MKAVALKYPDQVRIVYKPVAIVAPTARSPEEVVALYLANEQGKFVEMLDLEFLHQNGAGLSVNQLSGFARQLEMDATDFGDQLTDRRFSNRIRRQRQIFDGLRLSGVPTLILEGRVIHMDSRSVGCLSYFIEQELQAKGLLVEPEAEVEQDSVSTEVGS